MVGMLCKLISFVCGQRFECYVSMIRVFQLLCELSGSKPVKNIPLLKYLLFCFHYVSRFFVPDNTEHLSIITTYDGSEENSRK